MMEPNPFDQSPTEPKFSGNFIAPDHTAPEKTPGEFPPIDGPQNTGKFRGRGTGVRAKPPEERTILDSVVPEKVVNRKGQFVKPMTEFYVMLGMAILPIKPTVGKKIVEQAGECAEAWDELAHENETVRRYLKGFLTVNTTGALIFAHAPIFLAVAVEIPFVQNRMGKAFAEDVEEELKKRNE